jgi:hypothetical protein
MEYVNKLMLLSPVDTFNAVLTYFQNSIARILGILHLTRSPGRNVLNYTINGRRYCVVFPNKRGPKKWSSVVNENGTDVSNEVDAASGVCYNFHHIPTTPEMLGYGSLTFTMTSGETFTFDKKDIITFS